MFADLLLSLASLLLGAAASAASSRVQFLTPSGVIFYVAFPIASLFLATEYWRIKKPLFLAIRRLKGNWNYESTTSRSKKKARGNLTFSLVAEGISAEGPVIGENGPIGKIRSDTVYCDPKKVTLYYMYSVTNDNGNQVNVECILTGWFDWKRNGALIHGQWRHLDAGSYDRPSGTVILTRDFQ